VTAVVTTQRVNGWINPDTSASSMNSSGPTTPSTDGASAPGLDAEAGVAPDRHVGLVLQDELFALERAASSAMSVSRRRLNLSCSGR
jgi:hypothetical protein